MVKIILRDHLDYTKKVYRIISEKNFLKLFNYTNFSLCKLMNDKSLDIILESNNKKIIKYVISNLTFFCVMHPDSEMSLIHYLVYFDTDLILVNYLIDKYNLDIESKDNMNETPIFQAIINKKPFND